MRAVGASDELATGQDAINYEVCSTAQNLAASSLTIHAPLTTHHAPRTSYPPIAHTHDTTDHDFLSRLL